MIDLNKDNAFASRQEFVLEEAARSSAAQTVAGNIFEIISLSVADTEQEKAKRLFELETEAAVSSERAKNLAGFFDCGDLAKDLPENALSQFYTLIDRYRLPSDFLSLYDFFSLRIYEMLKQLLNEAIDIGLVEPERKRTLLEHWGLKYIASGLWSMQAQANLQQGKTSFPQEAGSYFRNFTQHAKAVINTEAEIKKFLDDELQKKLPKIDRPKTRDFFKKKYKDKIESVWTELKATVDLFHTLLSRPEFFESLDVKSVKDYPGTHTIYPSNFSEVQKTIENLSLYAEYVKLSYSAFKLLILNGQPSDHSSRFPPDYLENLLEDIAGLSTKLAKMPSEQVLKACRNLIKKMFEEIPPYFEKTVWLDEGENLTPPDEIQDSQSLQQTEAAPVDGWYLSNRLYLFSHQIYESILHVLDDSIIRTLNPSEPIFSSYLRRASIIAQSQWADSHCGEEGDLLVGLCEKYKKKIDSNPSYLKAVKNIQAAVTAQMRHIGLQPLNDLADYLKPLADSLLDEVLAVQEAGGEDFNRTALLERTKYLAQTFVFLHDVRILRGEKPDLEEGIFPKAYFDFLMLDERYKIEDFSEESEFSNDQASEEREDLTQQALAFEISNLKVETQSSFDPALQRANPSKTAPLSEPSASGRRRKKMPRKEEKKTTAKKEKSQSVMITKRRVVEKMLSEMGLRPVRQTGPHEIWRNHKTGAQTAVPRHTSLNPNTVNSILNQAGGK